MNPCAWKQRSLSDWLLSAFAFSLPLTISVAEPVLFALILAVAASRWRRPAGLRACPGRPYLWPVGTFVALAVLSILWSVRPEISLGRVHRLLMPGMIFAVACICRDREETPRGITEPVAMFLAGCTVLALYDIVRIPRAAVQEGALAAAGNMRDPQMYLASMAILVCLMGVPSLRLWKPLLAAALAAQSLGMVLHCKRGVWAAFLLSVLFMGGWTRRWKPAFAVLAVAAAILLHPAVRARVADVRALVRDDAGGRIALWTDVAPALLPRYPFGMGWCAVTHDDLSPLADYLQPTLDHLHNNLLQVALETGWLGLAAWLAWMGTAFVVMGHNARGGTDGLPRAFHVGILGAFTGLMVNGLVEYNFGDTEILMLFCFLMGLSLARPG